MVVLDVVEVVLLEAMVLVLSEPTAVVSPLTVLPEAVLLPPLLADEPWPGSLRSWSW